MDDYQVLFSGDIVVGAQRDVVRQNVARGLGLDKRKVDQLFSGRTVVIKSQLSQQEAFELQCQLADFGAVVRVKDLTLDERAKYKLDNRQSDRTMKDITAAHQECPRCGHLQLDTIFCARCGVDIAAAMRQKRKEDVLIEKKIQAMRAQKTLAVAQVEQETHTASTAEIESGGKSRIRKIPFGAKSLSWLQRLKGG